jgi:peroxiredoxin
MFGRNKTGRRCVWNCMKPISLLLAGLLSLLFFSTPLSAQTNRRAAKGQRFEQHGPKPGKAAPDFELKTTEGKKIRASALWKEKPTVIMTASFTCPIFRQQAPGFESLTKDFDGKVNFLMVYTLEAHPKGEASPYSGEERVTARNQREGLLFSQPKTMEDRVAQAKTCQAHERMSAPMVIDTMENSTWKAYGSAPNAAYLVGRDGKIVEQQGWFDPEKMRTAIVKLLPRVATDSGEKK